MCKALCSVLLTIAFHLIGSYYSLCVQTKNQRLREVETLGDGKITLGQRFWKLIRALNGPSLQGKMSRKEVSVK